jgi:hypothetical protein
MSPVLEDAPLSHRGAMQSLQSGTRLEGFRVPQS